MGKNSAGREARRARQEEKEREARVKTGSEHIRARFKENFGQPWFDSEVAKQFAVDDVTGKRSGLYAQEFDSQWETARKNLEAALMNAGLYNSTEGEDRRNKALEALGQREQDLKSRALATVQQRQSQIGAAEDTVLGQLRSSADIGASNAAAANQVAIQSQAIPFSPLGAVFQDFTAGLATQAELERQGNNRYNVGVTSLFNNNNPTRYSRNVKG